MYDAKSTLNAEMAAPVPGWRRLGSVTAIALFVAFCAGCAAPLHADQTALASDAPDTPDAVFELLEQEWTLKPDGAIVYREKKHLKLNSDRTYRALGDPRIAYNADNQKVEVLEARTRLPNGKFVDLADYSTVEVAPDAAGGWPAFGGLHQRVMVMGGIEPGCVLETEYQITTKARTRPYLAADLRIDREYPVRAHTITITLPQGKDLSPTVSGLSEDGYLYSVDHRSDGTMTHRWVFAGLPAQPNEPQALPWQQRGVRLCFTTAPNAETWITERLAVIDTAADESPLLTKLASEWTKDAATAGEKLRALQKKLADSFNFVDFDVDWRPAEPRRASEVLYYNYGLPAESAAVLLSLARAAGVAVQPGLLVNDEVRDDQAPQAAMVAAYVLAFHGPDGLEIWHPRHGRIQRDKTWAGHTLAVANGSKVFGKTLPAWSTADESRCVVTGNVTIADDGKCKGKLTIKTTGLFVSPNDLETRDDQKKRVEAVVEHVLPGAKLTDFTLKSLAAETFEVEAEIASTDPLEKLHGAYQLALAQTSPALAEVTVPTAHAQRETAARMIGPFDERIELTIIWPEGWIAEALPSPLEKSEDQWGSVSQTVVPTDTGLKLVRHTRLTQRDLPAAAVIALRKPLNELRCDHARTLLLKP